MLTTDLILGISQKIHKKKTREPEGQKYKLKWKKINSTTFVALVTYCCPFLCVARQGSWELWNRWDLLIEAAPPAPLWRVLVAVGPSSTDRCWRTPSACQALTESSHTCLGRIDEKEKENKEMKTNTINAWAIWGAVFHIWRFHITWIVELLTRLWSNYFGVWIFSRHLSHGLNKWPAVTLFW